MGKCGGWMLSHLTNDKIKEEETLLSPSRSRPTIKTLGLSEGPSFGEVAHSVHAATFTIAAPQHRAALLSRNCLAVLGLLSGWV